MTTRHLWVLGVALATLLGAISGCTSKSPDSAKTDPAGTTSTTGTPEPSTSGSGEDKPADTQWIATLPADLKGDAFGYYGLSEGRSMEYRMTAGGTSQTGTQTITFKGLQGDVAKFSVERGGDLAQMGSTELELRKDGIYAVSSSIGDIGKPSLEMPMALPTGKTWTTKNELKQGDSGGMTSEQKYRVVGLERVTTPAGPFEALLVTSEGPASIGGKPYSMKTRSWFVKDLGAVKWEIETVDKASSTKNTVSIELVKK